MELLGKRCQNCKSVALLDEGYQVVCTECGLCDSLESVPNIDSVTQLVGAIRVSTAPTTTQLEMVDLEGQAYSSIRTTTSDGLAPTILERAWK
jgi:MinD superfamily P-loop ATPase